MLCCVFAAAAAQPDPLAIVRKAVSLSLQNDARTHQYSLIKKTVKRKLRSDGSVASTETETFQVHSVAGEPVKHLIQRNGRPLSESEAREEKEKFNRTIRERENEASSLSS